MPQPQPIPTQHSPPSPTPSSEATSCAPVLATAPAPAPEQASISAREAVASASGAPGGTHARAAATATAAVATVTVVDAIVVFACGATGTVAWRRQASESRSRVKRDESREATKKKTKKRTIKNKKRCCAGSTLTPRQPGPAGKQANRQTRNQANPIRTTEEERDPGVTDEVRPGRQVRRPQDARAGLPTQPSAGLDFSGCRDLLSRAGAAAIPTPARVCRDLHQARLHRRHSSVTTE
ncbi:uncharacterized protein K452DRAFT_354798 [Aplosporella prunicola CBS 121167]|uniref:Uncharacterized protein n=1 Tax=Aplosporella prunicola CBS 121167 TaxID=1176127 RepID=A0A6A6BWW5_9PEZI|nr:uncharacterized protein K452DRAFT_354798 [Aplosporella prunicola CBS 121167]KAF2147397.1 hypothetical protein K452DRAFT_354798 [Aplosporella prunicola CBS 121167]